MEKQTLDKLKYLINKRRSVEDICSILEVEVKQLYEMVLYLKKRGDGYDIVDSIPQRVNYNGFTKVNSNSSLSISDEFTPSIVINEDSPHKICLLSDIHYGSLYDRPDIIKHIYSECEKREIRHIFCCGDLTNGNYSARPSFIAESKVYKSEDMLDYVASTHPYSRYINFYTISGNHDDSYLYTEGIDICEKLTKLRPDITYLGRDIADVIIGSLKMRMYHGCGKKRRSVEDRVTRFYDKIDDSVKPDILQIGHIHHSLYLPIGTTHIFQTAALIDQIPFKDGIEFPCERSCWYVTAECDENGIPYKVVPEIEMFGYQRLRK